MGALKLLNTYLKEFEGENIKIPKEIDDIIKELNLLKAPKADPINVKELKQAMTDCNMEISNVQLE